MEEMAEFGQDNLTDTLPGTRISYHRDFTIDDARKVFKGSYFTRTC